MRLTVRDVSELLGVAEPIVIKWIKNRALPARQIDGRYLFHRAELLEWATANRIKVSLELFDKQQDEGDDFPGLVRAIEAGGIHYDLADTNKERALRAVVDVLPLPEEVDRELVLRLFLAREASATTAIGDGIALPHVRNPIVVDVDEPMITLCFLKEPVDFAALDGKRVHVMFILICPTPRSHLRLLSRLSFALHDDAFKRVVVEHGSKDNIMIELRRVEDSFAATEVGKGAR